MEGKAVSLLQEAVDRDNRNRELKLALAELLVRVSEGEGDGKKRDAFLRRAAALLEGVAAAAGPVLDGAALALGEGDTHCFSASFRFSISSQTCWGRSFVM